MPHHLIIAEMGDSLATSRLMVKKMDAQVYVSLSVGMWRANGNPSPCTVLIKFCTHIPTCSRKVLV